MSNERKVIGAEVYARVFENHAEGKMILEDLVNRFGANPYVKGGLEGDRETCFKAGQNRVLHFILGRINAANGESEKNEEIENG